MIQLSPVRPDHLPYLNISLIAAASATQCRSNRVSSRRLPETGIFQISAGDCRRFLPGIGQIWSLEADRKFAKARHWRAFLVLLRVKSLGAGLVGWLRSGIRTNLHAISLLTGNLTGKIAVLRLGQPGFEAGNPYAAVTIRAIPFAH